MLYMWRILFNPFCKTSEGITSPFIIINLSPTATTNFVCKGLCRYVSTHVGSFHRSNLKETRCWNVYISHKISNTKSNIPYIPVYKPIFQKSLSDNFFQANLYNEKTEISDSYNFKEIEILN